MARLKGATNELPAADAPEAIEAAPTPGEILAEEPVAEAVTEGGEDTASGGRADKA